MKNVIYFCPFIHVRSWHIFVSYIFYPPEVEILIDFSHCLSLLLRRHIQITRLMIGIMYIVSLFITE